MDVIAAIATGGAPTAIGIVRVSGPGCFSLCGRVFRAANGRTLEEQEPRRMVLGDVIIPHVSQEPDHVWTVALNNTKDDACAVIWLRTEPEEEAGPEGENDD